MWLKISTLLLLAVLTTSHANPRGLVERGLIERFSSNPKILSVFSSRNSGKSLIEKFMGDTTAEKSHFVVSHPTNTDSSSEEDSSEEISSPDCLNNKKSVVKPIEMPGDKVSSLDTLDQINHDATDKLNATDDMIKIPLYHYKPANYYRDETTKNSLYSQNDPDISDDSSKDEYKIQLTHAYPAHSENDNDHYFTLEKVTDFADFNELFNRSKVTPILLEMQEVNKLQPNSLSYRGGDGSVNKIKYLSKEDPKNPPAPLERQPNLLLIDDWLDMSKKVYQRLKPEEKKELYNAYKARIGKPTQIDTSNDEVALKLIKDEYLIAEKDKKYEKINSVFPNNDKKIVDNFVLDTKVGKIITKEQKKTIDQNRDINVVHKLEEIFGPPPNPLNSIGQNNNHNQIYENNNNKPSQYVIIKNITRTETNPNGYVVKNNFTKTTVTVNHDDPIVNLVPNHSLENRFQQIPWTNEREDPSLPLFSHKVSSNKIHDDDKVISQFVTPESLDGNKVYTSADNYDNSSTAEHTLLHLSKQRSTPKNNYSSKMSSIVRTVSHNNTNKHDKVLNNLSNLWSLGTRLGNVLNIYRHNFPSASTPPPLSSSPSTDLLTKLVQGVISSGIKTAANRAQKEQNTL